MSVPRKILFADPDPDALRAVAPHLRERGYEVYAAADGSRALELAILRGPDLVVYDAATPLLEPRTFLRILKANPRTGAIPVLVGGGSPGEVAGAAGRLEKPYRPDVLLARVDQLLRRADAARGAAAATDLAGDLEQIPLPDLLQILSMNRKSGRLRLDRGGERGEIALLDGQPVDARAGAVSGEKALFRLLARRDGTFTFQPGPVPESPTVERRLEELLLEGLRQGDELAHLRGELPEAGAVLRLAGPPGSIPRALQPVTEEVVRLLESPRTLADLLDLATAPDLEAARAACALLEHGHVVADAPAATDVASPLLGPEALHAVRVRIARGAARGGRPVAKVVVAGGSVSARHALVARLASLPGWEAVAGAADVAGLGTLGTLDLGAVRVDLLSLPGDLSHRPLWEPFASGAIGALVLLPAEGTEGLLLELTRGLRLPVAVAGAEGETVPPVLREAPGGAPFEGRDAVDALRALLVGAQPRDRPASS